MKHIWLEKENIYRAMVDFVFGFSLGSVSVLCLLGGSIMFFAMFLIFTLMLLFAGIMEFKNDIAYDGERMKVRTAFSIFSIDYRDIRKIERIWIMTGKTGHWRWHIITDNEKITVPFPDSLYNEALADLFDCIKKVNDGIKWNVPVNPVAYPK